MSPPVRPHRSCRIRRSHSVCHWADLPEESVDIDRIAGSGNTSRLVCDREYASDIDTIKPTLMDGHFLSFQISEKNFDTRIRPRLGWADFTNFHLLRGQDLPSGWPESVERSTGALSTKVDSQRVLVHYDRSLETAYASVQYVTW